MNEPTKNDNDSIKTSVSSQNPSESIPSTSESKNFSQNNDVNQQSSSETKPKDYFECNICLDTASEPVLTQCGHLFW
jgi:E3 ubiquitin-protein ligase RNF5